MSKCVMPVPSCLLFQRCCSSSANATIAMSCLSCCGQTRLQKGGATSTAWTQARGCVWVPTNACGHSHMNAHEHREAQRHTCKRSGFTRGVGFITSTKASRSPLSPSPLPPFQSSALRIPLYFDSASSTATSFAESGGGGGALSSLTP